MIKLLPALLRICPNASWAMIWLLAISVIVWSHVPVYAASQAVGQVLLVRGVATAEGPNHPRETLEKGSEIFELDTLQTSKQGYLVIKMVDDTKITLRPDSQVTLDKFNTDPGEEAAVLGLLKGGLRAITGSIAKINPLSVVESLY